MREFSKSIRQQAVILFILFVLGSMIGWGYETIFYYFDQGTFVKRGQGLGPWLPIYGFGSLGLSLIVIRQKPTFLMAFAYGFLGGGLIEFAVGWGLYRFANGLRLWNYNNEIWNFGNIGGFICLRSLLVFGVLSILFAQFVVPFVIRRMKSENRRNFMILLIPFAVVYIVDMTWGYMLRYLR